MALITTQISERNFELIRDRIGAILTTELAGQVAASDIKDIWSERKIPFTPSELPCVNVHYDTSTFESKHTTFKRGENIYLIDVIVQNPTTSSESGDTLSAKAAQRYAGIIDYILEHPIYRTLGFDAGLIGHTIVEDINIGSYDNQDNNHTVIARLKFKVMAGEDVENIQPTIAEGYDTQVKLSETDFGHKYILNNN